MKDPKVIKTIRNKDVPDNIKKKAIAEARLIAEQGLAGFFDSEMIDGFVCWSNTPSEWAFWNEIYKADEIKKKSKVKND